LRCGHNDRIASERQTLPAARYIMQKLKPCDGK
jgi:hypothetical protein